MAATLFDDQMASGAVFSLCKLYRYQLWRRWDDDLPKMNAICLNPSTADETVNDPTVTRLCKRAQMCGYGGLVVTNLFAFRGTDPRSMMAAADPVGPENDEHILEAALGSKLVLAGWGNHGSHRGRAKAVRQLFEDAGIQLYCLKVSGSGEPVHPLYQPYELLPVRLASRQQRGTLSGLGDER